MGAGNGQVAEPKVSNIDAFVSPLTVPQFIDVVFGEMLQVPYVTGPKVASKTEVVQLRSSGQMKAKDFLNLVTVALEEYGVRVVPEGGAYQIVDDAELRSRRPRFIKSRARLKVRNDLRPVVQFVEIQALDAAIMSSLLGEAFDKRKDRLRIRVTPQDNYITLVGLPEDVDAALLIIRELDELKYAGSQVRRYSPKYWSAEDLSEVLSRALSREGWQVSTQDNQVRTISLFPVEYSNDVFIFTKSEQAYRRVKHWISELDRAPKGGTDEEIFVYQVKNVDAEILLGTINAVMGDGSSTLSEGGSEIGDEEETGAGSLSVDRSGNRIIFKGTTSRYEVLSGLLDRLDTPAPEVLIEVQIAEVTLTDDTSYGVDFFVNDLGGEAIAVGTSGLDLGSAGLTAALLSGDVEATLNAFASNRRVKILSTPVLTARSGGSAQIQVGQDVPIITSQRAANNQDGTGLTDILQGIDYRSTGVLLTIEPIVFSNGRIDLNVSQEVSSTVATPNATISSPTISSRTLTTQLALEDGQTAVLGGLIQENFIENETGVPILKDIPVLGAAFSVDSLSLTRTELVVLITGYVLQDQADKTKFVNHMSRSIDELIEDEDRLITLLPKKF